MSMNDCLFLFSNQVYHYLKHFLYKKIYHNFIIKLFYIKKFN